MRSGGRVTRLCQNDLPAFAVDAAKGVTNHDAGRETASGTAAAMLCSGGGWTEGRRAPKEAHDAPPRGKPDRPSPRSSLRGSRPPNRSVHRRAAVLRNAHEAIDQWRP